MDINIKPILSSELRKISFSYGIPISYSANGYTLDDSIKVDGTVKDMGGYIVLTANCSVHYVTECARCLEKLDGTCKIEFVRTVAMSLEGQDQNDEYILVGENSVLNIDEDVKEEIFLSLPTRSLCKDDCKGLCFKCGCNKNKTECSCQDKEQDPRWSVLKSLLDKE